MLIGIAGKTNVGKTSFFSAATLVEAEISNRMFTTIKPNRGVSYARAPCPCKRLGVKCNPQNSKCVEGQRFVPVKMIDVAGLVPGAHEGRGLGNQFLSDAMEANALIHVVDASGSTDSEGKPVPPSTHNPMDDVKFFVEEIDWWMSGMLEKNWPTMSRKAEAGHAKLDEVLFSQFSGLGIKEDDIHAIVKDTGFSFHADRQKIFEFASKLRQRSKPITVAANKVDIPESRANIDAMKSSGIDAVPCCAEAELALKRAAEKGLIKYMPGDPSFEVLGEPDGKQKHALEFIRNNVLSKWGSTGVQAAINRAVFDSLKMIVVYPVANISKFTDKKGNVLPDAFLVRSGTALKELAAIVHTELAKHFIGGLNIKRQKIGADYILQDGDVVEILFER